MEGVESGMCMSAGAGPTEAVVMTGTPCTWSAHCIYQTIGTV
jgi:hypothetical protein